MNYSFEEMLKYDMFNSVDEVKEFWGKAELVVISKSEYDQIEEDANLVNDLEEAIGKIKQTIDNLSFLGAKS